MPAVSVVVPAYNEENSIRKAVRDIRESLLDAGLSGEIIVVVDGANDGTARAAAEVADCVIEHPANLGYGRSLKTGILAAANELIAIMDADDSYPAGRLPELIADAQRYDMVVGARTGIVYQGGLVKRVGRMIFRRLAEFSVGQKVPDINSGMRVFRKSQIMPFFPIISAGFSFTTTCTLVYMHNDLFVHYVPIEYRRRKGNSKVHHMRDSLRALQIIAEAILRCNPVKMFLLLAAPFGLLAVVAALVAVLWRSPLWALASVAALCTTGLVLGMGFLAVALMPMRRVVDHHVPAVMPPSARFTSNAGKGTEERVMLDDR
jgi:glycosyltransferase involved in cell wall biosynthesis